LNERERRLKVGSELAAIMEVLNWSEEAIVEVFCVRPLYLLVHSFFVPDLRLGLPELHVCCL